MTRPPSYDIGDTPTLYVDFTDASGTATNPTTVTLTLLDPDGTSTSYTFAAAQLTNPSPGRFEKAFTWTKAGNWLATWTGTGAVAEVVKRGYYVRQAGELA